MTTTELPTLPGSLLVNFTMSQADPAGPPDRFAVFAELETAPHFLPDSRVGRAVLVRILSAVISDLEAMDAAAEPETEGADRA